MRMSIYSELKRRNVFRVAIAYLAAAWLLIEVAGTLFPGFGIPDWAFRFVVIVLSIGFLPTLIFSWAYEITPEGLKREKEVMRDLSITHLTAKRLDSITIGLIILAIAFIFADRTWLSPRLAQQVGAPAVVVSEPEKALEPESVESPLSPNSIAVLPFINMSDDPSNEYFSDGITEELLNLLSQIPGLRVIARTSSFAYKGKDTKISEIARELDVGHILEGSVRKAGNKVRITAQLIRTSDSSHIWSETFDRDLDNIFAIQDEIASTVVKQLKVTLLGSAPTSEEIDPEAYALFLQARYLARQNSLIAYDQSIDLFKQVLDITPNSAAAWNGIASIYREQTRAGRRPYDEGYQLVREAADNALALNPTYAPAFANLGWSAMDFDLDLASAARFFERALELEPANLSIIADAAILARNLGRLDMAISLLQYVLIRDPLNPKDHSRLGIIYFSAGQQDAAISSSRTALMLSPKFVRANYQICEALLQKGDPDAAFKVIHQEPQHGYRLIGLALVYHALGQTAESNATLAEIEERYEQEAAYNIAYIYAFRGETDRAFEWLNKAVQYKDSGLSHVMINPLFASIHSDPRWLPFLESIGKSPQQLNAIEFEVELRN